MDALTAFGLLAVSAMLATYALEDRSHWFVLAFGGARGSAPDLTERRRPRLRRGASCG